MGNSENRAKRRRLLAIKEILSWMVYISGAVLIALLLRIFVFELVRVDGPSMQPTLYRDQTVFVEKLSIARGDVDRFEVVIARYPGREGAYVKRVVGLPGDTIEIRSDGHLYINGVLQEEPYILEPFIQSEYGPYTVPEGCYFVMGDNRNHSNDSRDVTLGTVDTRYLLGKAEFICFPFSDFGRIG